MRAGHANQMKNPFVGEKISRSEKSADDLDYLDKVKQFKNNPETLLHLQSQEDPIYKIANTLLKDQKEARFVYPEHCQGYGEEPELIKAVVELLEESLEGLNKNN